MNFKNYKGFTNFEHGKSGFEREDGSDVRIRLSRQNDSFDNLYGFERIKGNIERVGWLLNMHTTEVIEEDVGLRSAVDFYFLGENGSRFRATMKYKPYFYILPKQGCEKDINMFLTKKYGGYIHSIEPIIKENLDLANHLVGLKQRYLKLNFLTIHNLLRVRRDILAAVRKNREREKSNTFYSEMIRQAYSISNSGEIVNPHYTSSTDNMENIMDIREYDVPYHIRVCIDNNICAALWYNVKFTAGQDFEPIFTKRSDIIEPPDCIVFAYDIETTKLPLKFPDPETDQIMMISYMIDGQGYLITNRDIVSSDVDDFEYTPTKEFEGNFTVFNELNEAALLQRFFDHIIEVRPHVFVTYNGDFFDWRFVEARAKVHDLSMFNEIGVAHLNSNREGYYAARPAMHMDCFSWVKRDSYLPVGSQGLKAVAKAKLRYNPVELDPEEMCRMASENPQILATYSVSDAVATYYLYMKYVHPFVFALSTIIPMEPDEVLRKGSGTLCESLLMVEAVRANVIFPNKQESVMNKMTEDGHVLEEETYVGGHVEALESGVFRSDIQTRFKLEPDMFQKLIDSVEDTIRHALEVEEKVPLDSVLNLEAVVNEIKSSLSNLRDNPIRVEFPVIYHLDVGAMYPNIILTNRLQPDAMVDESVCAACDFNKPNAKCKRGMEWTWRGEVIPASRAEFHRIQQQLEMEKFPSAFPGGTTRAFHQLSKEDRAKQERKRVAEYSRKVYKKTHVTRVDIRTQTVCQKENSFYVDTVRAFRDRRYEYKALNKAAKSLVAEAIATGDAGKIKSAKNREVIYDSLQLAHKCILNSFYGYVMRRGARWHSMEMAGIVCHTGANIIKKAREIVECIGRPLELDTDGIWCILPKSFPENYTVETNLPKKPKLTISYANAVLNRMVKDDFTNEQYHELICANTLDYEIRAENSIFFEVDGPYLAMILPASKEEGKKLKKRYAVFNKDKTLAELKGFEIKRRGELQLIKIFQSSVFDAFLEGNTLESCYESVARVADYWLDVLYTKAQDLPDSELFDLISENRSMSRKLEDYGQQKSTSISTAKRLAEFLGDQMLKDAGLSCRFIISKKPEGAPVTERAIPLAIFHSDPALKKYHLRRWLKDQSIVSFDIRSILDWEYYIERLSGAIQKIITIPAALQGVPNPVPRVSHPDWLHKRILEKNDTLKQRKITEVFPRIPKPLPRTSEEETNGASNNEVLENMDIEEMGTVNKSRGSESVRRKRGRSPTAELDVTKHWEEVLGPPPSFGSSEGELSLWLEYNKRKWEFQQRQKQERLKRLRSGDNMENSGRSVSTSGPLTISRFLRRAQQTLLSSSWQVLQIAETGTPGMFRLWVLVGHELHQLKLNVPRIFYMNYKEPEPMDIGLDTDGNPYGRIRKCSRFLPRSRQMYHLYEYTLPEYIFQQNKSAIDAEVAKPIVEGIYETQVPLEFRAVVHIGCFACVEEYEARMIQDVTDTFELKQLTKLDLTKRSTYIDLDVLNYIFLYQHKSGGKCFTGVLCPGSARGTLYITDTIRNNQMPTNLTNLYNQIRLDRIQKEGEHEESLPQSDLHFDVVFETRMNQVFRHVGRNLQRFKEERKGPTILCMQSPLGVAAWNVNVPATMEFPSVPIYVLDEENAYNVLNWQRVATRLCFQHFFRLRTVLGAMIKQARYLQIPLGNMRQDPTFHGCDVLYARSLINQGYALWCSQNELPDLGGKEIDDSRLTTEFDETYSVVINNRGSYQSVCVELNVDGIAVNALLQSGRVQDAEGTSTAVSFDANPNPKSTLDEMIGNTPGPSLAIYDESALSAGAFRILRQTIGVCFKDATYRKNLMADYQLIHVYRWLRSPYALLYDPALRKTLLNLMKKLFFQLCSEFIRLGSTVVYADYSKLIVSTKKNRFPDAESYVKFVHHTIKEREIFHGVHLGIKQMWHFLLWLDLTNYFWH